MKTTINIADNIAKRARRLADEEHLTLRALVEEGLRLVIERHGGRRPPRVKPVTFKGKGLTPAFRDAGWGRIRDAAYEGRGS